MKPTEAQTSSRQWASGAAHLKKARLEEQRESERLQAKAQKDGEKEHKNLN